MTDRAEKIEDLYIQISKFGTYLVDLRAEQNRLQGATATGDLISLTRRLAQINSELAVGNVLFTAAKSALSELKRADRFYRRAEEKQTIRNLGPQKTL